MIDNCQSLSQVSLLPMSKVVNTLRGWGCEFDCSTSDQSLRLELMQILALNGVLDAYEKAVVDSVSFAKHYVQSAKAIDSILSDEYYLEVDCAFTETSPSRSDKSPRSKIEGFCPSFSHLAKTLLICALEDGESSSYLIVLGTILNVLQFEFLVTSPAMSQTFLNDLCKRIPAYIIESTDQLLEEYGFVVPQALTLSEDIWKIVLTNCGPFAIHKMKLVSRKFHELATQTTLPMEVMIELAINGWYGTLYANRQSITKENYLELVKAVILKCSLRGVKAVIDIALKLHADYDVMCKREILCIIQASGNTEFMFYFYERFEEYVKNSQWELNARHQTYLQQGRELAKLKRELLTINDSDMPRLLRRIGIVEDELEHSLSLIKRATIA